MRAVRSTPRLSAGVRNKGLALLVALSTLAGCDAGTGVIKWQEEVELKSGEVIRVDRTAKYKSFGEWGGPGGWENEGMTLRFSSSTGADTPPIWDAKFVPVVFDRDATSGEWFIVATFYSCESWYALGQPKLPYTEYRFRGGVWQQVGLSASVIGLKANMLTAIRSGGEPSLIDIAAKRERMADPRITKKFTRVVQAWSTSC